jgi:hypothetical protein
VEKGRRTRGKMDASVAEEGIHMKSDSGPRPKVRNVKDKRVIAAATGRNGKEECGLGWDERMGR